MKLAIIVGEFHKELADRMLQAAMREAEDDGWEIDPVIWVPGSFEVPLALKTVFEKEKPDAAVVLGYIERGQTQHGEVMGHVVHRLVQDLSLEYNTPVGIGIIGPGAIREQADARVHYGATAVKAALTMHGRLKKYR